MTEQSRTGAGRSAPQAMPPQPADQAAPDYVNHGDGFHSHKHVHGTHETHYHRHQHQQGDAPHTHHADDPIHAEHPDHRRQHVGG